MQKREFWVKKQQQQHTIKAGCYRETLQTGQRLAVLTFIVLDVVGPDVSAVVAGKPQSHTNIAAHDPRRHNGTDEKKNSGDEDRKDACDVHGVSCHEDDAHGCLQDFAIKPQHNTLLLTSLLFFSPVTSPNVANTTWKDDVLGRQRNYATL